LLNLFKQEMRIRVDKQHTTELEPIGVSSFKLTATDLKIIKALQIDARISFTELAKELGVSKNTVSNRVKLLKENGIITGSLILVNLNKFGVGCIATLGIKVIPSKLEEVMQYVKSIKGADFCGKTIGSYNMVVFLFLDSMEELKRIIETIKKDAAVIQVNTSIWTSIESALARPKNIDLKRLLETPQ
jgi:Lrp/AsnC family leucine-responsive transcriptional regulator